ncbi:acetyltransferase [Flavobacterium psychrophilum]|uniref:acetyltransferase n=1 Tax=Flavobacterium psychrophilum TaxID=96345 RepID=UPI00073E7E3B|nr:acetyltransferase [Flavobacterium psychrophilum]EKT3956166.1 acetyltransferase [Flavobacterium psychrophilum]EKT4498085.1 acetyltransferase [Flavobacterium psychrophilum]EKT4519556.1 acetyltransferase [Flavobacterium psychrophilum]EKT4549462.1 acetyltransferase [Flavobacterium psychrophilum]ELM3649349.1 acetyltransferase [Flavobacterium psychrophilum]
MKKIAIIGAGGFGREVKMLIDQINLVEKKYEFIGFYDDGVEIGTLINGFPVLGKIADLNSLNSSLELVLAIGTPSIKKAIIKQIENVNVNFPTLIHPSVLKGSDEVLVGKGSIICAGVIITCNIAIGDFVTINLACTVGHDTIIYDYVSIMPGVNVSGEVILHEGVYIGTGAKIINQVEIGFYSIIGSGAVVSKSIPENCTAVGIPAKPIKFH